MAESYGGYIPLLIHSGMNAHLIFYMKDDSVTGQFLHSVVILIHVVLRLLHHHLFVEIGLVGRTAAMLAGAPLVGIVALVVGLEDTVL